MGCRIELEKELRLNREEFIEVLGEKFSPEEAHFLFRIGEEQAFSSQKWKHFAERLRASVPWQYILEKAYFRDLELYVNPNVLVPRPETEELVDWILADYPQSPEGFLDFATGSGCIALALKKSHPISKVAACDFSESALAIAKKNSDLLDLDIHWFLYDILHPYTDVPTAEVWVCNPPYIAQSESESMSENVLQNEPHQALFVADSDPLIFYAQLAILAQKKLPIKGSVYFEINQNLAEKTYDLLHQYFSEVILRKDISGNDRMIRCRKPLTGSETV